MNQEKTGKFLVSLRKARGWTQKEVAKRIGVTEQAVSKWERGLGFPDVSLWKVICQTYDISLMELMQGERIEEQEERKSNQRPSVNEVLQETLTRSDEKIQQFRIKNLVLLAVIAIALYIISLALETKIINLILFGLASLIVIYFLGMILKKWNYGIRFTMIAGILLGVTFLYASLESVSILNSHREPIFAIKEIYKEYNVTLYNSWLYVAYRCDGQNENFHFLEDEELDKLCPKVTTTNSLDKQKLTLKSGAEVTKEQIDVLENFNSELLKQGYVDYNYMRQQDIDEFFDYIDRHFYCNVYEEGQDNLVVKREGGVCQYDKEEYYYCTIMNADGTITYTKAQNQQCP